ncbi:MAG: hypothetical protein QXR65_08585 [Candidatus Bathyarchaeia archaeon]|nr:hypothetical protein [Candidatus Bathyarchaeota archaeon]
MQLVPCGQPTQAWITDQGGAGPPSLPADPLDLELGASSRVPLRLAETSVNVRDVRRGVGLCPQGP